jgi:hypothetical protein
VVRSGVEAPRRFIGSWCTRARAIGAILAACALPAGEREAAAVLLPTTSASAYIQTSGPNAALTIGDFYTNVNGANDPLGHRIIIDVPCAWSSTDTVTVALFDPESQTPDKVMDATAIRGEMQPCETNQALGPAIDLTGERGITIVTAYDADPDSETCQPLTPIRAGATQSLIGSWTIADLAAASAAGSDAIGIDPGASSADGLAGELVLGTFAMGAYAP